MHAAATVVLDRDDMRRTLVRIAHEIVEKNPTGLIAIVGIHRRGAHLARRLQALTAELVEVRRCRSGTVDIAFYRDDLAIRPGGYESPVVHSTELDFPVAGRTIVIVDDVLYTGRTVRAAIDETSTSDAPARPAGGAGRPRTPRAADPPRLCRQEHPNLAGPAGQRSVQEVDGVDEVAIVAADQRRVKAA